MSACRSCGAPVAFAKHNRTGRIMCLELAPETAAPRGLFEVYQGGGKAWARSVGQGEERPDPVYRSHHATCPEAEKWRR